MKTLWGRGKYYKPFIQLLHGSIVFVTKAYWMNSKRNSVSANNLQWIYITFEIFTFLQISNDLTIKMFPCQWFNASTVLIQLVAHLTIVMWRRVGKKHLFCVLDRSIRNDNSEKTFLLTRYQPIGLLDNLPKMLNVELHFFWYLKFIIGSLILWSFNHNCPLMIGMLLFCAVCNSEV